MQVSVTAIRGDVTRAEQRELVHRRFGPITYLCPHCGSDEHGRPRGPRRRLSVSFAPGLVLVAEADSHVGVDVEADGPPPAGFVDRAHWTRVEALLKASGEGLRVDPWSVTPGPTVVPVTVPAGWVASVALLGQIPSVDYELYEA